MRTVAAITVLGLVAAASAHTGCAGHEVARRNPGGPLVRRQSPPTDEGTAAGSTDPDFECKGYSYQPVISLNSSYPQLWQPATIVSTDSAAQSLFATINATINSKLPTDLPHCAAPDCISGDFQGVVYDIPNDPDCWWSEHQCTTPSASTGLPADIVSVPEPDTWGLGFDDGPNCSHNAFYDYLAQQNQKATMFYIGSNVWDWPLQAMRAITDGHQICVHTWSHRYMTALSNEQAFAELYYTRKIIKDVLGVTPLCWRPPFGDVDNRIRMIAQALNLTTIVWGYDTFDWKANAPGSGVTPQDVNNNYQTVFNNVKNGTYSTKGAIVLTHELNNYTMSEAQTMLPAIKSAFKYVVPICSAMNQTHPYVETTITCPDFASYIGGETNTSTSTTNSASSQGVSGTSSPGRSSPSGTSSTGGSSPSGSSGKSGAFALRPAAQGWILAVAGILVGGFAAL